MLAGAVREDCQAMSDNQRVSRITLSVDRLSLVNFQPEPTVVRKVLGLEMRICLAIGLATPYSAELTLKHTNQ